MENASSLTIVKNVVRECPQLTNGIWGDVLTKWTSLDSLSTLEVARKFKTHTEPIDLEVTFKGLHKGTIILTLEGVFYVEWENKVWKKDWNLRKHIESTNIVLKRATYSPRIYRH